MLLFCSLLSYDVHLLITKSVVMISSDSSLAVVSGNQSIELIKKFDEKKGFVSFEDLKNILALSTETELDNLALEERILISTENLLAHLKSMRITSSSESQQIAIANCQLRLQKSGFLFCLLFGGLENAATSLLFSYNLFLIIPGITAVTLYSMIAVYIILSAILFYSFEISFLKKAMGMDSERHPNCLLNETYDKQLKCAIEIGSILDKKGIENWNQTNYEHFLTIKEMFDKHLLAKEERMKAYSETDPYYNVKVAVESAVVLFGALSCVADSYFIANTALMTLHISLMSSPVGFILVIGMVTASLILYYTMRIESLSELINPDRNSYLCLQTNLGLFKRDKEAPKNVEPKGVIFEKSEPNRLENVFSNNDCSLSTDPKSGDENFSFPEENQGNTGTAYG